ncbi:MAG: alpha/beta hydrolase family protein [Cyclobacteriaceae bacterium]
MYLNRIKFENLPYYEELVSKSNDIYQFRAEYEQLQDLEFDSLSYLSDGYKIFAYLIKPKDSKKKLPCIIYNRGGNRDFSGLSSKLVINSLSKIASKGFIIIASSYRGNKKSEGKDEFGGDDINDVLQLISLLEEIPNADTKNIGMYGWSRGGLMTYISLTKTNKIKTAVIGGSPTDMFDLIRERPAFEKSVLEEMIPYYEFNREMELLKRSPIKWINKLPRIPLLIIHGENDDRVSATHAVNISKELTKENFPHKLVIFKNSNHNISEHRGELNDLIINWFLYHLSLNTSN